MVKIKKRAQEDAEVFRRIQGRLNGEIGGLMDLVDEKFLSGDKSSYYGTGNFPYWSMLRSLLPIAESIGALLYDEPKSGDNLKNLLKNELKRYEEGYAKFPEVIVMLFRHPLIHTDEIRVIKSGRIRIGWSLTAADSMRHMKVTKGDKRSTYRINFSPRKFYENLSDLLEKCIYNAKKDHWKGVIAKRYIKWGSLNLDDPADTLAKNVSKKSISLIKVEAKKLAPQSRLDIGTYITW